MSRIARNRVTTRHGVLRSGVRVRANGHTGTVCAVNRTESGRYVIGVEWDDLEVALSAQRHGITFITRPHLPQHRDAETLEII